MGPCTFSITPPIPDDNNEGFSQPDIYQSTYVNQISFGPDKLYKVKQQQMKNPLHRNIVAIICRYQGQVGRGTGALISPNLVLTSAHNLFCNKKRIQKTFIQIYPGQWGQMKGYYKVEDCFIPQQYEISSSKKQIFYDYALIKLSEQVKTTDFIHLKEHLKQTQEQIAIFGYPRQSYQISNNIGNETAIQWGLIKKHGIIQIRSMKNQLIHSISTSQGHSGSPIFLILKGSPSIVGIHKGGIQTKIGNQKQSANVGVLITENIINILKQQSKKLGAIIFNKSNQQNNIIGIITPQIGPTNGNTEQNKHQYTKQLPKLLPPVRVNKSLPLPLPSTETKPIQNALSYINKGISYSNLQRHQQAVTYFEKAIQLNPDNYQTYNYLATACFKIKDYQKAINYYKQSIKLSPFYFNNYVNLASTFQTIKRYKQAIEYYAKAMTINPNDLFPYSNLVQVFNNANNHSQAIQQFEKNIQMNQYSYLAYNYLGQAFYNVQQYQQAINYYKKSIKINPYFINTAAYINLGSTFSALKKYQQAKDWFNKAKAINPSDHIIYINLAATLNKTNQYQLAIKNCRAAISLNQYFCQPYHHMGMAYIGLNNYQYAISYLNRAILINPRYFQAYEKLGLAHQNMQKSQQAISCFKKAIQINPKYSIAYFHLGSILKGSGRIKEAIDIYRQLLKIDPNDLKVSVQLQNLTKNVTIQ